MIIHLAPIVSCAETQTHFIVEIVFDGKNILNRISVAQSKYGTVEVQFESVFGDSGKTEVVCIG
jgi:hypothetical protein